jgi:hypothetical protein
MAHHRMYGYASPSGGVPAGGRGPCGNGRFATSEEALPTRARQKGMVLGRGACQAHGVSKHCIH